MANVFDTAKYILEQSGSMSTMKLQKLCWPIGSSSSVLLIRISLLKMLLLFSLHINPAILPHFFPKCASSRIRVLIRCHKPLFCARLPHGFPHFAQSSDIRRAFPIIVSAVCIHNSRRPFFQQCCDSFYGTVPYIRWHWHYRLPV